MEINQFTSNLAAQFDETDASEFTPQTKFRDLEEWSSLTALSIIAMVDEEYQIQLKGEEIRNAVTIENLFNIIKSKL